MTPKEVIDYFGSHAKAAAEIGISTRTIQNWVSLDRVPRISQFAIESITKRKLKADKS